MHRAPDMPAIEDRNLRYEIVRAAIRFLPNVPALRAALAQVAESDGDGKIRRLAASALG